MDEPVQVLLAPAERRSARLRAAELGLSLPDYILRLVRLDLDGWTPAPERPAAIPIEDAPAATAEEGMEDELGPAPQRNASIGEAVAARIAKVDEEGRQG